MADVLQDVGLESDFLQQLLSAGAEVALFYHLRAEKGAAVRTVGGGDRAEAPRSPCRLHLCYSATTIELWTMSVDSRNRFWAGLRYFHMINA